MKESEIAGLWSLPEAPDRQIVGHVKYSQENGFDLKIPFGHLRNADEFLRRMNHDTRIPLIKGTLRNGKRMTLVDCLLTNTSMSIPGGITEEYWAPLGFTGDLSCGADPLVDSATISYSHLRDWVARHPLTSTHSVEGEKLGKDVSFHYETPKDRRLVSGDGWQILLRHTMQMSFPSTKGVHLNHDCALVINFSRPMSFSELQIGFWDPYGSFYLSALIGMSTSGNWLSD